VRQLEKNVPTKPQTAPYSQIENNYFKQPDKRDNGKILPQGRSNEAYSVDALSNIKNTEEVAATANKEQAHTLQFTSPEEFASYVLPFA